MNDLFDAKQKPSRLTSADIRSGMSKRWAAPEYAIMWEVGEATGAQSGRYADAVIMSLWPSRGLELHGVEIKISRADWRREAADPKKAEAIAKFCDRWWVHTAPNVVADLSEVPPAWGMREYDGRAWKTVREAGLNTAAPLTRGFLASLLRRADGTMRHLVNDAMAEGRKALDMERDKERTRWATELESAVVRRTGKIAERSEDMALFEAAFGGDHWKDWAKIGAAAKALADVGDKGWAPLAERLRAAAHEIAAIAALAVGAP